LPKKVRRCIDCGVVISDKRYKTYRGNRAKRCEECQERHLEEYHRDYWQKNKYKYKNRWIERLGNPSDDDRFFEYQRGLRECKDAKARRQYINKYKAFSNSSFRVNNQAEYPSYDGKRVEHEEEEEEEEEENNEEEEREWGEEYTDQDDW